MNIVCSTSSLARLRIHADRVCREDLEGDDDWQWLQDVACDASKISYGEGSVGFVTLNVSVAMSDSARQLASLREVCTGRQTRRAFRKVCGAFIAEH